MRIPAVPRHFLAPIAALPLLAMVVITPAAAADPSQPTPEPVTIKHAGGTVVSTSRLRTTGGHIATRSAVRMDDGRTLWVTQPGGAMGGFRTTVFPSAPLLEAGQRAELSGRLTVLPDGRLRLAANAIELAASPAGAPRSFVDNTSSSGQRLHWAANCIYLTYDAAGTEQIAGDREFEIIDTAVDAWMSATAACSYLNLIPERASDHEVAVDGINLIKFRDARWCVPATADAPEECLLPEAAALTWLQSVNEPGSDRDGEIVDADIQINGEYFAIAADGVSLGTASCLSELSNVITHELGHLLGLGHTCRLPGEATEVDHDGAPVPLCSQTNDPAILEATMAAGQDCGETKKASLEGDDIAAICTNYAVADKPGTCERADLGGGGCCSAAGGDPTVGVLLSLFALGLLGQRRPPRKRPAHGTSL